MSELQPDVQMSVWTGAQHTSCCLRFLPALFFLALSRVLSSLLSSSAAFGAPCCWVLYTSSGARIAASDATYTDINLLMAAARQPHFSDLTMQHDQKMQLPVSQALCLKVKTLTMIASTLNQTTTVTD